MWHPICDVYSPATENNQSQIKNKYNKIDISKIEQNHLEFVLNQYAERGRYLYEKLFLNPYLIDGIKDAQKYIDEIKEYGFIYDLFKHLYIDNWLEV